MDDVLKCLKALLLFPGRAPLNKPVNVEWESWNLAIDALAALAED